MTTTPIRSTATLKATHKRRATPLAVLALGLLLGPPAEAAHQFNGGPGYYQLPLVTGQKLDFSIDSFTDQANGMAGGTFTINFLDLSNPEHPDLNWSPGDMVKITIDGVSITLDSAFVTFEPGDPNYAALQGSLSVGNTVTVEMVSGMLWFRGIFLRDGTLGHDVNGSTDLTITSSDPNLPLPQLYAIQLQSFSAPLPPRAADALANDEDHASPPPGELPMNVGVPVTVVVVGTGKLADLDPQWAISGVTALKDYSVSSDRSPGAGFLNECATEDFDAADLMGPTQLTFYSSDVGTADVLISDTVGGDAVNYTITFDVVRDPKAEPYRVTGDGATGTGLETGTTDIPEEDRDNVLGEHQTWHDDVEAGVDPGEFLRFHRGYGQKFDCWRQLFGYACVPPYISGPDYVPSGDGVDHTGTPCSTPECDPLDGSGDGIVVAQRDTSDYASIPALPEELTIVGVGTTMVALADFADEDALATALESYVDDVIAALDIAGDLSAQNTAPADPMFWRVHRTAAEVFALWQFLRLDGDVLHVPVVPGETDAVVHYPDPVFQAAVPGCPTGVIETCTPASGSTLALGSHPVSCTVRDVMLLDPGADPMKVGTGTTTTVNFTVDVLEPADVVLVIDDTGSMNNSANDGTGNSKMEALENAVEMFSDLLGEFRSGLGDKLGVIAFKVPTGGDSSDSCQFSWSPQIVAQGVLDDVVSAVHPAVLALPADGIATPIRRGLDRGISQLKLGDPLRRRVMMLMTDGHQNTANCTISDGDAYKASDLTPNGIELLSIGFGGGSVNSALLSDMSVSYQSAISSVDLAASFVTMLTDVLGQDFALDPQGSLAAGGSQTYLLPVTSLATTVTFLLNWASASESLDLSVETPDGTVVTLGTTEIGLKALSGSAYQALIFHFPLGGALTGNHAGTWKITASRLGGGGLEPYNLMVLADSPLHFNPVFPGRTNTSDRMPLLVRLEGATEVSVTAEVDVPLSGLGSALVSLGLSDSQVLAATALMDPETSLQERRLSLITPILRRVLAPVSLFDDGLNGDGAAGDGLFGGEMVAPLATDGGYTVLFRSQGVVSGEPFLREIRRAFYVGVGVSVLDEMEIEQLDPLGRNFRLVFRPQDANGLPLGLGFASAIGVQAEGAFAGPVEDLDNGFYAVEIVFGIEIDNTNVEFSIVGTPFSSSVLLQSSGSAVPSLSAWTLTALALCVMAAGALLLRSTRGRTAPG